MNHPSDHSRTARLYLSEEHPCSYLDRHTARTLFLDPYESNRMPIYEALIDLGFRRSGEMIYRPDCPNCRECTSLRLPVNEFRPRRIQRRIWKRLNSELHVIEQPTRFDPDQYALFKRYIAARHQDGEMSSTSEEGYLQFINGGWSHSCCFTFYHAEQLVAVAVTDILRQGLSAVYTFFEPEAAQLSLGTFCLLWQIEECKRRRLPWLYLGYWIRDCQKMSYKNQYFPHDLYLDDHWVRVNKCD